MPDDNIIPKQEITDLPKIDEGEKFGGISFVPETTPKDSGIPPAGNAGAPKITPLVIPGPTIVAPPPLTTTAKFNPPKPPVVTPTPTIPPEIKPSGLAPFATIAPEIKPIVIVPSTAIPPDAKPPASPTEVTRAETPQKPAPLPKEAEPENKTIIRPEPLKMPGIYRPETAQKETAPTPVSTLKAIRTYQADVAESVKGQKTSLVRMVVAEQARKQRVSEFESPSNKWNIVFIIGGFILLLSGTVAGVVVFNKYKQVGTVAGQPVIQSSFIFAENGKIIPTTGLQTEVVTKAIANEIKTTNNKLDTIENISVTENTGGGESPLITQRLFYFLDNRMPPALLRSLDGVFMLGVHTFNGNHPFIILKTNFYENTFAGMLGWEQYMARDLFPVFGIEKNPDNQIYIRPFEDKTLKNRDTRVLKDDNGSVVLLYTFKDKETLIITTSSDTMEEVIRRLNSSRAIGR